MQDLWEMLATTNKPVVIYGTGNGADKIINQLYSRGINISAVFASNGFVRNRVFRGFKVLSFEEMHKLFPNAIVLIAFGSQLPEVLAGFKRIVALHETYAPDVPVVNTSEVFDNAYFNAHKEEIDYARSLLCDDESINVFNSIINYKLTGKTDYLFGCESSVESSYSLLSLSNESYLDLGAYNGDTVLEFVRHTKNYGKIIAVEPDIKNYNKLAHNTSHLKNMVLVNAAVSDVSGIAEFSQNGGRNSHLGGGRSVNAVSVDNLLNGTEIGYIKMDVEGAEKKAILGAENTLKVYKPKLNIAAYHRNEDIFVLPALIYSINNNYKIYLRHHPYIPAWDTNIYAL